MLIYFWAKVLECYDTWQLRRRRRMLTLVEHKREVWR